MASYPVYDVSALAAFSGRPEYGYDPNFIGSAIKQSIRLFKLATCLTEWPDNADDAELAEFAVLSMIDAMMLRQPYEAASASPMQSETIGSYNYSKMSRAVQDGEPTGVGWFDRAVAELGVCDVVNKNEMEIRGASYNIFGNELPIYEDSNGNRHAIGPMDDPRYMYNPRGYYDNGR